MICAIVLAAGESRRMGAHKVLLPFGAGTVIEHIVDQLLRSAIDHVIVVVGHEGARVAEVLVERPVSVVTNPIYREGMLTSVRSGLKALPPRCETVVLALGDQPALTAALVDELLRAYKQAGKGLLVPLHGVQRGHPLVFAARYGDEILTRFDDAGLRGLLRAHADDVVEFAVPDDAILSDMDYPEDYRRELARLEEQLRGEEQT